MISLQGKRILVTREAADAKIFAKKIAAFGGIPIITPLLQINCLPMKNETASSLELAAYDWVFFTSKNGVNCFLQSEAFAEALASCRIAAVGPKTKQTLEEHGFPVDFVPSTYNAQVMATEFLSKHKDSGPVLFVRGTLASAVLPEAFTRAGQPFTYLEVYEITTCVGMKDTLRTALQNGIDLLTFTSPSTIDAFIELVGLKPSFLELPIACIGSTTENYARKIGFEKTIVPKYFTIEGMIEAMSDYLKREVDTNE